jgi:hypothetical protein
MSRESVHVVTKLIRSDWYCADIIHAAPLPQNYFDIWHDRAVFHFLTEDTRRVRYIETSDAFSKARRLCDDVYLFTDGPEKCSGLDVVRYDSENLHAQFGKTFKLIH